MDGSSARAARHARLVLVSSDDPEYARRIVRRDRLMALSPIDPTDRVPPPAASAPGVYWEYLLPDETALFMRVRDFADEEEARMDAHAMFARSSALRVVYVRDRATGHVGWWIVRGSTPVLVPPRVWLPTRRGDAQRMARRAMRAFDAPTPPWGTYER